MEFLRGGKMRNDLISGMKNELGSDGWGFGGLGGVW